MKIRTEISDIAEDEIVIRCRENNDRIKHIRSNIEAALRCGNEMALYIDGTEYLVSKNDILFFESSAGKVFAHTADRMYTAPHKLFELEESMPPSFVRVSKSVIVNVMNVASLKRELVGNGEFTFRGSDKKTYFSRTYYKLLQYKIDEMRLKK